MNESRFLYLGWGVVLFLLLYVYVYSTRLLNESTGSLLDDVQLVNTLQSSKVTATEVSKQLESSEQTELKIDSAREVRSQDSGRGDCPPFLGLTVNVAFLYYCMLFGNDNKKSLTFFVLTGLPSMCWASLYSLLHSKWHGPHWPHVPVLIGCLH